MQPHVKRVLDERDDLARKCDALLIFLGGDIFLSLPKEKKDLMHEQYAVMRDYLTILGKRLALEDK
jgi:GTP cyclohydrolase III